MAFEAPNLLFFVHLQETMYVFFEMFGCANSHIIGFFGTSPTRTVMLLVVKLRDLRWGASQIYDGYLYKTWNPNQQKTLHIPNILISKFSQYSIISISLHVPKLRPCQVTAYAQVNMVISAALKPPIWVTASCAKRFMITWISGWGHFGDLFLLVVY